MADSEKKRVTNYLKKQVEIDPANIREVANQYRHLNEIADLVKKEMDYLKKILLEAEVEEYFTEDEQKVVFQEGAKMTEINTYQVFEKISQRRFLDAAKISESNLKTSLLDEPRPGEKQWDENEVNAFVESVKLNLGQKRPSIRVSKMTKKELQEMK